MLYQRILRNLAQLAQGKIKARKIPSKITNFILSYSESLRQIKRSRFAIDGVIFRPVEPNDGSRYAEFLRNYYFQEDMPYTGEAVAVPHCNAEYFYHVAVYQNKIVGGVGMGRIPSDTVDLWRMGGLSVLRDLRGYGIGERLLKTAISAVGEGDAIIFLNVDKNNMPAVKLYKKAGFHMAGGREKTVIKDIGYAPGKISMVLGRILN
ncbi:MAG: GNAT family N-acetyltransferase [Pseudomonadota bacterium]